MPYLLSRRPALVGVGAKVCEDLVPAIAPGLRKCAVLLVLRKTCLMLTIVGTEGVRTAYNSRFGRLEMQACGLTDQRYGRAC